MSEPQVLPLTRIQADADLQARVGLNDAKVAEYAERMRAGDVFPPLVVFADGAGHFLADGFHRLAAAAQTGVGSVPCDVRPGSRRDAMLYAATANTDHGLPRTDDDKRRAITMLLTDAEWSRWADREIARRCHVSPTTVGAVRAELSVHVGQIPPRLVERGGTTYEMQFADRPPAIDGASALLTLPFPGAESEVVDTSFFTLDDWERLTPDQQWRLITEAPARDARSRFNRTNDNVDWARWTWNPVTGCLHDCAYCYARRLAELRYPQGFAPSIWPGRLWAPRRMTVPAAAANDERERNVFVCSMADLFGKWVPAAWIDAVLAEVTRAPDWNFLFLTKFPQRLAERDWPANAWVGTTVDQQYRVAIAEKAFRGVRAGKTWLSCEPLLEDLTFTSLEMFDGVVIGAQSAVGDTPAFQPPWEWVEHLMAQARAVGCDVFLKDNLKVRPRELPGSRSRSGTIRLGLPVLPSVDPAPAALPSRQREDAPAPAPDPKGAVFTSDSEEWCTPTDILAAVIAVLGAIDLDPCSNPGPVPHVPAAQHYTRADDGLRRPWIGRVFMNPPYGRRIGEWVDHLIAERAAGRVTAAIALVAARTETRWFRPLFDHDSRICFLGGRLEFIDGRGDGDGDGSAPFPSAAIYVGPDPERFAEVFGTLGVVVARVAPDAAGAPPPGAGDDPHAGVAGTAAAVAAGAHARAEPEALTPALPRAEAMVRSGGPALIVQHCAVFGRLETPVRQFSVGEVQPYAQYPCAVSVMFQEPRKRRRFSYTMVPGNRRYLTIDVGGQTVYDSRAEVPCDMDVWKAKRARFENHAAIVMNDRLPDPPPASS